MDLQYDAEQTILRDTAENFLRDRYDYKTYQRAVASDAGWSRELWGEFARLGWLGLPFAAEDGGVGGGPVETAILMEAFGRSLVIEPYLSTVVLSGGLIAALGSATERKALLEPVIEGKLLDRVCPRRPGRPYHREAEHTRLPRSPGPRRSFSTRRWPICCSSRLGWARAQMTPTSAYS